MLDQPDSLKSAHTPIERILAPLPLDVRSQILDALRKSDISEDQEDILFQIVELLGIYAVFFQAIPEHVAGAYDARLAVLDNLTKRFEEAISSGVTALDGEKLIAAITQHTTAAQQANAVTEQHLVKSTTLLKDLSATFSEQIKEDIVKKTLNGMLEQVKATLANSKKELEGALEINKLSAVQIEENSRRLLAQSEAQLKTINTYDQRKALRIGGLIGICGAIILGLAFGWGWSIINHAAYERKLQAVTLKDSARMDKAIKKITDGMSGNKVVLQKLAENGIRVNFVNNGEKKFLVIPTGLAPTETINGVYIELPDTVELPDMGGLD